jgi:hypothetical protein
MITGKSVMKMSDYMIMYDEKNKCHKVISKRLHQCWKIMEQDGSYRLFHKEKEDFIPHGSYDTPFDCVVEISSYDDRKLKKIRRESNCFYKMIQQLFDKPATI